MLVTTGITLSFFNYAKLGTTENSITSGTIEFLYTELDKVGAGIAIEDAYPVSDEVGKSQTGAGKVFNFKVTSQTPTTQSIPYTITARKSVNSTLNDEVVKVFLKETTDVEIEKWVNSGKAMDKAGAYGMQNEFCVHVEKIEGNYTSVVGLPTHKVYDIIKNYIN